MKRLTLKQAREQRDMTQAELARAAKLAQGQISAIESGAIKQPEIGTMDKLSQALGMDALCSVAGLFFEEKSGA